MFSQFKKVSAAAALLVAIPTLASAQTVGYGNTPVTVTAFGVTAAPDWNSLNQPISLGAERDRSNEEIAFHYVNTGKVAATSVTFVVNDGVQTRKLVANGTFAPGVTIARTFTTDDVVRDGRNASFGVAQVRFADGNVWNAPAGVASNR